MFEHHTQPWMRLMGLAMAEHSLHHDAESRRALEALSADRGRNSAYQVAEAHAWRGEVDQAFTWLGTAVDLHDAGIAYVKWDPLLARLRSDPRYRALLERLMLPPG